VLNAIVAPALLGILWWKRGKAETLRPSIICAIAVAITHLGELPRDDGFLSVEVGTRAVSAT
jgi:hypothetical protein